MAKFKESVYENEYLKKYVKDKEEAKSIGSGTSKKILWECPNCHSERLNTPSKVKSRGFKCYVCEDSRSYSEKLMEQLLIDNNIVYETQKRFDGCKYKSELPFDFYLPEEKICIEMQGEQHYDNRKNSVWYDPRMEVSDAIKKKFCLENNLIYIDINCTVSDIKIIIKNIDQTILKNILTNKDIGKLKKVVLTRNLNVDVDHLIKEHRNGKSFLKISEETGVHRKRIVSILRKMGEYKPRAGARHNGRKVICLNDKKIYNTIKEAITAVNLKQENNIMMVCKGQRNYAGKHPETGEPLKWMYYEDYINQQEML